MLRRVAQVPLDPVQTKLHAQHFAILRRYVDRSLWPLLIVGAIGAGTLTAADAIDAGRIGVGLILGLTCAVLWRLGLRVVTEWGSGPDQPGCGDHRRHRHQRDAYQRGHRTLGRLPASQPTDSLLHLRVIRQQHQLGALPSPDPDLRRRRRRCGLRGQSRRRADLQAAAAPPTGVRRRRRLRRSLPARRPLARHHHGSHCRVGHRRRRHTRARLPLRTPRRRGDAAHSSLDHEWVAGVEVHKRRSKRANRSRAASIQPNPRSSWQVIASTSLCRSPSRARASQ
jgi:hypothetical protein